MTEALQLVSPPRPLPDLFAALRAWEPGGIDRWVIAGSLALICGGFFTLHAAAVGALNARLTSSRGRANSLYVLLYYLGGAAGITAGGSAYVRWGWPGAAGLGLCALLLPLGLGIAELRRARRP